MSVVETMPRDTWIEKFKKELACILAIVHVFVLIMLGFLLAWHTHDPQICLEQYGLEQVTWARHRWDEGEVADVHGNTVKVRGLPAAPVPGPPAGAGPAR